MKKAFLGSCLYAALLITSCHIETQDPYVRKMEKERYSKDSVFRFSEHSPIHPSDRKHFVNLNYFEPKKEYIVKAKFIALNPPQGLFIQDSEGIDQEYFKIGKLHFMLRDKPCTLSVYQNAKFISDPERNHTLFLPFWDETNGKETYSSGRFMDIEYKEGMKETELDFNFAYNPYCAYTHDYKCPIPPAENRIAFRVEAGEKIYHEE